MLEWFTLFCRCIACQSGLRPQQDRSSFPLCQTCLASLFPCPSLCSNCGSPICLSYPPQIQKNLNFISPQPLQGSSQPCLRPWIHRFGIQSYSGRYLLFDSGYQVLKTWKKRRGYLFDRRIFNAPSSLISTWLNFQAEAITPLPQRFYRSWEMGGSRTELMAQWVSREINVPRLNLLESVTLYQQQKRQAELTLENRLQNSIRFKPSSESTQMDIPKRIILVDDFFTTGHSIRHAALSLLSLGVQEIHVFCLGIKVPQSNIDLVKCR